MTTTTTTGTVPTTAAVVGILSALGGRYLWRYWIATAVWLAFGLATAAWLRLGQPHDGIGSSEHTVQPAGLYLIACVGAVALLWGWGARFALSLGYRRGAVYGWAWATSLLLAGWVWLSTQLANHAEIALVGRAAHRAFAVETGDKFGSDSAILNGTLVLFGIYLVPLLAVWIVTLAGFVGRGALGALGGLGVGGAWLVVALAAAGALDALLGDTVGGVMLLAAPLHVVPCVGLGWLLFRRARA